MPPEAAASLEPTVRYTCHGCGYEVPLDEPYPFRCPNAGQGDGVDHLLRRCLQRPEAVASIDPDSLFRASEPNPFRKFCQLSYSFQVGRSSGLSSADYRSLVADLDTAIGRVDGRGFRSTPFTVADRLAEALGLGSDRLWVKDETGNVSGSHKARHLMGIMLWLEVQRRLGRDPGERPLGIASCGNAALAAAVVARAAGRRLEVFVPPDANRRVAERLEALGADLTRCPRRASDPPGDPCYLRFVEASAERLLPFTVQGTENGLAVEGGATLAWEMVATLRDRGAALDHLVIQVGGGGLASATIQGLREARALGLLDRLPRIHTVQTQSAFPLRRAYEVITERLSAASVASAVRGLVADDERALALRETVARDEIPAVLQHAARHRARFMWPWEMPPKSIAYGILDDETYDWLPVVQGMLETGGIPLVVSEGVLAEAHRLAHEHTDCRPEPTGTAGLAGLLELRRHGVVDRSDTVGLLFTGVER